ncbi:hypothetical protein NP493_613g02000 [Ridgeia piscesae]|uniref:Uncharacterized protein n=1 Tax=Ridgeia piscesae TaxID=27915 RepID=A0AAD9KTI4_RIDPI|nr:hypothetical protein NP493_613g02000 [Ridgeia piscesae]
MSVRADSSTCSYFDNCDACPEPLQCTDCDVNEVMSTDKQKCLACPVNCQLGQCFYNNETNKAECSRCNNGYALSDERASCTAVSGCDGSAAVLTEDTGTFGVTKTQYRNNMRCRWRIHVETTQVS